MVSVVDGCPEDPDSMGELVVQKKNVLFEAVGKEAFIGLPSPISSESFVFRVVLFLTRMNPQGSITLTPTGTRYTHILILIFSRISHQGRSWCILVGPYGRGR